MTFESVAPTTNPARRRLKAYAEAEDWIMWAARRSLGRMVGWLASMVVVALLSVSVAAGQAETCPTFVEQALDTVGETCGSMGRNQVCYGNNAVDAEFGSADVRFDLPGDRAEVFDLNRLTTAPLQPDASIWGVAVLALQADLPDNLPGQNATFVVFGDTEVMPVDAPAGYDAPMQAFSLNTRIGGVDCEEVPDSGVLVQVPQETTVHFLINEVEVKVSSSAFLQVDAGDLTVDTIEGIVEVTADGTTEVAGEGLSVRVPRGRRPLRAAITRSRRVMNAPWRLLPRQVRAMPPPPDGQIVQLNECLYANVQRAGQNPVSAHTGEAVVLRISIPHESLELAKVLQQQMRSTLSVNGQEMPPYTRIGPWRGERDEYDGHFGIELYWLFAEPVAGDYRVVMERESLTGRPIVTGIDGPDADSEPEIIPPRQQLFCMVRVE